MARDITNDFIIGLIFLFTGIVMVFIPNRVFSLILNISFVLLLANGFYLFYRFIKEKNKGDLLFSVLAFVFSLFLIQHAYFPQWLIRVLFAIYCLFNSLASFIQLILNYMNDTNGKFFFFVFAFVYLYFGLYLLFHPNFDSDYLLQYFGFYFIALGFRYIVDGFVGINPIRKYEWKRKIRITLPAFVCAFMPDWALNSINHYLSTGKSISFKKDFKDSDESILKVLVHVGPVGFQKVGHISFSYKDVIYSYGNYDPESFRLNQTLGDGVFFNVPIEYYVPNMLKYENNSIFEYGIKVDKTQEILIESSLQQIKDNSYRWYCKIEKEDGYTRFTEYESDYPSRLHYRTGAKFYKIKHGKFKSYFALGDNCALFTDVVLGKLGSDVLNMRGIISPGTYLDYLQNEYLKKNSPVIYLKIHSNNDI